MENLNVTSVHQRTASDLENNNSFDSSSVSNNSLTITKMNTANLQSLKLGENGDFVKNSDIALTRMKIATENEGNNNFDHNTVIVNIIDDDGNVHARILSDEESKDGSSCHRTPDSHPRTPRSKSHSISSETLLSSLR